LVERVDGDFVLAVAAKTVVGPLLARVVTRWYFAQTKDLSVKAQRRFRIKRVVGDVADARKRFFFSVWHAETLGRQTYRMAFGVVHADLAVMNIFRFLQNHAARIDCEIPPVNLFQIVSLQADIVESRLHTHFTEGRPLFEQGQVIETVGYRDIAFRRAANLVSPEKATVKLREGFRILADASDVAQSCHRKSPCEANFEVIGVVERWS